MKQYLYTIIVLTTCFTLQASAVALIHEFETEEISSEPVSTVDHGFLFLSARRKTTVPDVFSYIDDGTSAYSFFQRDKPSGKDGYFPAAQIKIQESSALVNADDLRRGYYKSKVRLANTPEAWIFGVCSRGAYFFSKRGMFRLIDEEKPETIVRYTLQE